MSQKTKFISMSPNLMVKDIKASHNFYLKTLGFKLLDQEPKNADAVWMMFAYNDITIMIQSTESITEEIPQLKSEHTGGTLTFYITISDVNSYYKKVSESAKVIKGLEKTFYGATEFTIEDPDGYLFTFAEFDE